MIETGLAGSSVALFDAVRARQLQDQTPSGRGSRAGGFSVSTVGVDAGGGNGAISGLSASGLSASVFSAGLITFLQQTGVPQAVLAVDQTSQTQQELGPGGEPLSESDPANVQASAFDVAEEADPEANADQSAAERAVEQATDPDAEGPDGLTSAERQIVTELRERDAEVRRHEQAHAAVGGPYAGAPTYTYETGPDGQRYAIAGEVEIDAAPIAGDPAATIRKLQVVRRAALAPAQPSPQDRRVAAQAQQDITRARAELAQERVQGDAPEPGVVNAEAGQVSDTVAEFDPTPNENGQENNGGANANNNGGAGAGGGPGGGPGVEVGIGAGVSGATPQPVSDALEDAALLGSGDSPLANFPRLDPGRLFNLTS